MKPEEQIVDIAVLDTPDHGFVNLTIPMDDAISRAEDFSPEGIGIGGTDFRRDVSSRFALGPNGPHHRVANDLGPEFPDSNQALRVGDCSAAAFDHVRGVNAPIPFRHESILLRQRP